MRFVIWIQSCLNCNKRSLIVSGSQGVGIQIILLMKCIFSVNSKIADNYLMSCRHFVFDWYLTLIFHFNCLCHWDMTRTGPSLASQLSLVSWWSHIMITITWFVIRLKECSLVTVQRSKTCHSPQNRCLHSDWGGWLAQWKPSSSYSQSYGVTGSPAGLCRQCTTVHQPSGSCTL